MSARASKSNLAALTDEKVRSSTGSLTKSRGSSVRNLKSQTDMIAGSQTKLSSKKLGSKTNIESLQKLSIKSKASLNELDIETLTESKAARIPPSRLVEDGGVDRVRQSIKIGAIRPEKSNVATLKDIIEHAIAKAFAGNVTLLNSF